MTEKVQHHGGSPDHEPTLESRAKVAGFTCAGFNQSQIAKYFQIDDKTLRKHYRDELDKSKMDKTMILGDNLYKDAVDGDKVAREFWLKTQGRWSYAKDSVDVDNALKTNSLLEKLVDKL